ncbi:alpha-ketoglutarate decarboxylase [Nonlabens spongiae]|uniref:Alpha-ketoglutarate decarboxylase n=1 Tax=Nonlabens spongiae TaxID=331648 RepID=A0A1W6ML56_9FLAO|nr:alpha-ketoglutarate decarboxylase [Nonlabens spongiae]ARN78199.1 alpha-ketoglutarate decarboxylase [Nonlabens spongiae]
MNRHFSFTLFVFLFFIINLGAAQSTLQPEERFWDRVLFGGNLGASFGNDFTSVIIAPQAIYKVNDFVGLGVGLNYSYSELDADDPRILDYSSNIYGGGFIGLFNPIPEIQASFDFEVLNVNRNFEVQGIDEQYWVPALFLGAGYRQGNFIIGARYDVLYNEDKSVYNNGIQPFVRVFF